MVRIGIVGLGPQWDERYGPILKSLRRRIAVRAVYDCVTHRAEQVSSELGANVVQGVRALMERSDIQAILWLDPAWLGIFPLRSALQFGKPIFVGGAIQTSLPDWKSLYQLVQTQGLTAIPELHRRYTPATSRLQELIATRLGRPQRIRIRVTSDASSTPSTTSTTAVDTMLGLMDWCRYVMRSRPKVIRQVTAINESHQNWERGFEIEFHERTPTSSPPLAELTLSRGTTAMEAVHYEICCENGRAWFYDSTTIIWESGSEIVTECLQAERHEIEVMLDLFCRRVVGGLIPVADLGDICRGLTMVQAAWRSLETNQPITLNGELD
ncbi:MAG: Gfo/Idh/MocA family oxidoreductase [Planctomycetaceae bacterium]